jgi:hypothetical protein
LPFSATGAAELGHRQHDDVGQAVAEVTREGGQRGTEVTQPIGELALIGALAHVRVPAVDVGKGDPQTHVGADELGDLPQRLAEAPARVVGAVGGGQARRARAL